MGKSLWKKKCINNNNNTSNNHRSNQSNSNNRNDDGTNRNDDMLMIEYQGDAESAGTRGTGGLRSALTRMLSN